jgi:hypothetical protein
MTYTIRLDPIVTLTGDVFAELCQANPDLKAAIVRLMRLGLRRVVGKPLIPASEKNFHRLPQIL